MNRSTFSRYSNFGSLLVLLVLTLAGSSAFANDDGIFTSTKSGANRDDFKSSTDVYVSAAPGHWNRHEWKFDHKDKFRLADGTYFFQVTDEKGKTLLSSDSALCRQLTVSNGRITGPAGPACKHGVGDLKPSGSQPVQLYPFTSTVAKDKEYKVWVIPQLKSTTISTSDPRVLIFERSKADTAEFEVKNPVAPPPPAGSCQGSSSLTVLVTGKNVMAYVPKGNWSVTSTTGVSVVNVEGNGITNAVVPTPNTVNSCASNPLSGQTVCTANNSDVYLLTGTALTSTLSSAGTGQINFSGGSCTNCGVAIDAVHNKAAIGLSIAGAPGFQVLNLGASPTFEPPFVSPSGLISEDPLMDPTRNLLLSPAESGAFEIVNLTTSTSPTFFENMLTIPSNGELDSAAEECSTGIVLAPAEFTDPSAVFVADLTQATYTPGTPAGTWTAASQIQTLSESSLSAGSSGSSIAQGTHIGLITGEFGGNTVTAIALPATSGTGTPAITDWVTCQIGNGFSNGYDPHTVTAYQSPTTGNAIGLLADAGPTQLAVIDLTSMLNPSIVPRTAGGHGCAGGTLPSTVESFIPLP